jgi:hypothetical protein
VAREDRGVGEPDLEAARRHGRKREKPIMSGTIDFICPACHAVRFQVQADEAGKGVWCQLCGRLLRIPASAAEPAVVAHYGGVDEPALTCKSFTFENLLSCAAGPVPPGNPPVTPAGAGGANSSGQGRGWSMLKLIAVVLLGPLVVSGIIFAVYLTPLPDIIGEFRPDERSAVAAPEGVSTAVAALKDEPSAVAALEKLRARITRDAKQPGEPVVLAPNGFSGTDG